MRLLLSGPINSKSSFNCFSLRSTLLFFAKDKRLKGNLKHIRFAFSLIHIFSFHIEKRCKELLRKEKVGEMADQQQNCFKKDYIMDA